MKIRHKLTGEERELIFHTWRTTIQNKENYEVLEQGDIVFLRQIEKDGYRKYLHRIDRDHAIRVIKKHSNKFDFQEINDLPFELQARLVLEELKQKEERKGDLAKILNGLAIDLVEGDLKEFANYFEEKGWARVTLTKDASLIQATRKGLESLAQPIPLAEPLENLDLVEFKGELPDGELYEVAASEVDKDNDEAPETRVAQFEVVERGQSSRLESIPPGKSWFFGIGINIYKYFNRLNNAVKDVKDLVALLQEQYDLEPEHTLLLFDHDATHRKIINALEKLVKKVQPDDKLLIYYSGHGHLNDRKRGFWIPTDAEKGVPDKYIGNSTIRDYVSDFPAKHTLLISDSCFSGSLFIRGKNRSSWALDELEQRRSRWALCSGRHEEKVYDGDPGSNSPFAKSIIEVLHTNKDPKLNIAKLADRVMELTRSNYDQLPEGNPIFEAGHKGGQYIFRRKQKQTLVTSEEELWQEAKKQNKIGAIVKYLMEYPDGVFADEAMKVIKAFEETKTASRIRHKVNNNPPYIPDPTVVLKSKTEYSAALARLPHQRGKWAVFKDGAQLQGTVRATEDEAQSLANGLNNNSTKERITLLTGAYVVENGMPFYGTDRLPSWIYYGEEKPEGIDLVYISTLEQQIKVVKPDSVGLPMEVIENIHLEVNKFKAELLRMHNLDI